MTSFMRYIFGGSHSSTPSRSRETSSKATPRSNASSSAASNYVYVKTPSSGNPPQRLKTKRSNSYCARTATPSPLRYATFDAAGHGTNVPPHASASHSSRPSTYRRASYKSADKSKTYPLYTPSFGSSSRNNSNTSLGQGYFPPAPPSSAGSHHSVRYTERRPPLNKTHTWQSSVSSAGSSRSYGSVELPPHARPLQTGASLMHMHPLFASSRLHSAPLSYDVTFTPSARTVLDRTTHQAVPSHTLNQPCTDPPTSSMSRIVLRSDKFPWPVVVAPSKGGHPPPHSQPQHSPAGFQPGPSPPKNGAGRSSYITNLDLLYAVHTTLLQRVTPAEWDALGHGSRAQRKVTRAYESRCTKMGGGWEGGVRRIDWLHGKTRLVGVEVEKGSAGTSTGKLLFGKP